jgi:uncharacterized protein YcsI (UPF0317 family)
MTASAVPVKAKKPTGEVVDIGSRRQCILSFTAAQIRVSIPQYLQLLDGKYQSKPEMKTSDF